MGSEWETYQILKEILAEIKKLNKNEGEDFIGKNKYNGFVRVRYKDLYHVNYYEDEISLCIRYNKIEEKILIIGSEKDRFLKWFEEQKSKEKK